MCKTSLGSLSFPIFSLGGGVCSVELLVLKKFILDEIVTLSTAQAQVSLLLCVSSDRDNSVNLKQKIRVLYLGKKISFPGEFH